MTRQINVGGVTIGGGAPVVIQSMLNTKTTDVAGSLAQINQLKAAGCDTAKSVLELPVEEIASRADLELEQAEKVVAILKAEFEEEE